MMIGQMHQAAILPQARPVLSLDFTAGTLPSAASFSRSSTASYTNSGGVLVTAAANAPRFDYDPISGAAKGLLIEPQSTNMAATNAWPYRNASSFSPALAMNAVGPDGIANSAWTMPVGTTGWGQENTPITAGSPWVFSIYVKSLNNAGLFDFSLGGTWATGGGIGTLPKYSFATNSFTSTIAHVTTTAVPVGNGWLRLSWALDAVAVGSSSTFLYRVQTDPTASYVAYGPQLESGAVATSYIPTASYTAATRAGDNASIALGAWFNPNAGTVMLGFDVLGYPTSGRLLGFNGQDLGLTVSDGGSGVAALGTSPSIGLSATGGGLGALSKAAFGYDANGAALAANGAAPTSTANTALASATWSKFQLLGQWGFNPWSGCGHIRSLSYYNRRLPAGLLQRITTP